AACWSYRSLLRWMDPGPDEPEGPSAVVRGRSLVAGVEGQERQPRRDAGGELDDQVDPDRRPAEQPCGGAAERDGGVEHTAGDAADGERAGHDGEPDRQAEEPVAR